MKILVLFFLSFVSLLGFEVVLNTGMDKNDEFAILHLKNDEKFTCKEVIVDGISHFECLVKGNVNQKFKTQNFTDFDLEFSVKDESLQVFIRPKIKAKMFVFDEKLYATMDVKNTQNETLAKNFTFIFSKNIQPKKSYDGLNFDVIFPYEVLPSVGALDLDSNPVLIPQSADINTYIRIKNDYEKGNYAQVLTDAQNAINRYQGSIFMSEFILYKLRAQNQIYTYNDENKDQDVLESMVEEGKQWMRTFTSDKNFPEILYLSMRAYMGLGQKSNVDYMVEILKNEHPQNEFSQLALLDYAEYLYNLGKKDEALVLSEQIYYQSKNKDLASRAGIFLAKYYIQQQDYKKAVSFVKLIFESNPEYFVKDRNKALELAEILSTHKLWELSAAIYEKVFLSLERIDAEYESTLKNLALNLSKTTQYDKASKYLQLYDDEFVNGEFAAEIKRASDAIFFNITDQNATFLHEKFAKLRQEYDGDIAQRALSEDVKLYFNEGNFSQVLEFKDLIDKSANMQDKYYLTQAALNALNQDLAQDACIKASALFTRFKSYEINSGIKDKKHMLECLLRTSKTDDARAFIEQNYNEDEIYYGLQKANLLLDDKKYQEVVNLSSQILNSRILKSDDEKFKALKFRFLAFLRMNDYNNAIAVLRRLEAFAMNYEMVEIYDEFLLYCKEKNLQTSILTYAPKAIDYQNLRGINLFSPNLEFIYFDALFKAQNYEEALVLLKDLSKLKKLSTDERARIFYNQALVYEKMSNLAEQKRSLKQCLDINATSNWKNLCQGKNDLLNE